MNNRGDIPITLLVIEILCIFTLALVSFYSSDINARNSFVGIGQVQKLNAQIEQNYFYGNVLPASYISGGDIYSAINHAKTNVVVKRKCNCGDSCEAYAIFVLESSAKYGIEPILFLALMMQETQCNSRAYSGSSFGLMQINLMHCGKYGLSENRDTCRNQLLNVQTNIDVGARILRESYDAYKNGRVFQGCSNRNILYTEWEAALRGYNGWGCGTDSAGNLLYAQDNFVEEIMERTELLKKSVNYIETNSSSGFLWWKKESFIFSVEYFGE